MVESIYVLFNELLNKIELINLEIGENMKLLDDLYYVLTK